MKGIACTNDGTHVLSCGSDKIIKLCDIEEVIEKKVIDSLMESEMMKYDNISNIRKHHDV